MIFTIKIKLLFGTFAENHWESTIELDSKTTLEDLHFIIQDIVEFDYDHLYEFFISRTPTSRDKVRFDDENEKLYSTTLENLFPLDKGRNLYYLFDYGDHWLFRVSKNRYSIKEPVSMEDFPRMIEESGERPEQYPAWEE